MLSLPPPVLVAMGVISTAAAQLLLKRAASHEHWSSMWLTFMGVSAGFYVLSFAMYSQMLRYYALNKIYPATTVAQILLITLIGLMLGESLEGRQIVGLAFGMLAVYLLLT